MAAANPISQIVNALKYKVILLHNVMTDWNTVDSELCELAVERMSSPSSTRFRGSARSTDVVEMRLDPREHLVFNW
jgi:hypothetical protein